MNKFLRGAKDMKRLYLTDIQIEQLFSVIRWFFLIVCGFLFYYEPLRQELQLSLKTVDYLMIVAISYMLITQLTLFFVNKQKKLTRFIIKAAILMDFLVIFWLIALTGGINSWFVPVVYLFLIHGTIYWRAKGTIFAVIFTILGYTAVSFYQVNELTSNVLWTYIFNVVFFIIIGLFANTLTRREREYQKEHVTFQDQFVKDYITGLYNHRSFQNTLTKLTQSDKEFTLILADIDNFKQINDRVGHTLGDQVLSAFGNTLQHQLDKAESYSFRYGGEEFAIILFDRHKRFIEQQVKEWNILFQHGIQLIPELKDMNITISYGVAFAQPEDYKEDVLNRAEEHLYLAKSNGKDQIMFQESFERIGESR